jgi:hypothetical protein
VYNLNPAFVGLQSNVLDNQPYLNTTYNGIELTASKRFSHHWQMVAGFTAGKNTGGLNSANGQSSTADLNDPNLTIFSNGIASQYDETYAFHLSGSYQMPGDVVLAGSFVSNTGFPYVSSYTVTRAQLPTLTRSTQAVFLSDRGSERLPQVTLTDIRVSRPFNVGHGRRIVPQFDIFNLSNSSTVTSLNSAVGGTYLVPTGIVSPRIAKIGISVDF